MAAMIARAALAVWITWAPIVKFPKCCKLAGAVAAT
mgnify:CR=1 FL=1